MKVGMFEQQTDNAFKRKPRKKYKSYLVSERFLLSIINI